MRKLVLRVLSIVATIWLAHPIVHARGLTFEQRVEAQEAIERVYYSHQIGSLRPFDEALPRTTIEAKVREYLKQTVALEEYWSTTVSAEMLEKETERMIRQTQMPGRLSELFAALGNDAFVVQECLARAVLVDRLSRRFFAHDERVHGASWHSWWGTVRGRLDENRVRAVAVGRSDEAWGPTPSGAPCLPDDSWNNGSLDDLADPRSQHTAVWTGNLMLVWGGRDTTPYPVSGRRYDPATDSWTPMSTANAPAGRIWHTAVWTGSSMIVWGGYGGTEAGYFDTGGRYDPTSDSWIPTSTAGAPAARGNHTAVWAGNLMVVWGGAGLASNLGTGGRYDPGTDSWTPTSSSGAPQPRSRHAAVSTGSSMLLWGGHNGTVNFDNGKRYVPSTDTWTAMSTVAAPAARGEHTAVWTGSSMLVWGGQDFDSAFATGGRYDLATNSWTQMATTNAPAPRAYHTAVWTGSTMIVWGGYVDQTGHLDTGGQYDPGADSWTPTAMVNAPARRNLHTAVWTGSSMVVWGGWNGSSLLNTGARYDPASGSWTPTSTVEAPQPRASHTAVWTGNLMIVWGGFVPFTHLDTGGRYDPVTDSWTPTSMVGAPAPRAGHTAVWTGSSMIVWGGLFVDDGEDVHLASGGRYDPVTDAWTPTSTVDGPLGRFEHTAVWTGSSMIVWGGFGFDDSDPLADPYLASGGRYDPATDTWTPTSDFHAPPARTGHSAVWTGSSMILWGGRAGEPNFQLLDKGGRYDPATDSWLHMSSFGAPSARREHTVVWAGDSMVVWGGQDDDTTALNSGGRYDPSTNAWAPTTAVGAPVGRYGHTAIWTGSSMLVWGGRDGTSTLATGSRYGPASDSWSAVSMADAPAVRSGHTAVWTGSSMVVWGGFGPSSNYNTGGRYLLGQSTDEDGDGLSECDGDCNDGNPQVLPGVPETCDGLDNDCSGAADDLDADRDGFAGCSADCDDADPGAYTLPAEVTALAFGADRMTLGWTSAATAGPGTVHDVARGTFAELPVGSGSSETCLETGLARSTTEDESIPSPGSGYWYLVRGRNGCGSGTYGSASAGETRVTAACP